MHVISFAVSCCMPPHAPGAFLFHCCPAAAVLAASQAASQQAPGISASPAAAAAGDPSQQAAPTSLLQDSLALAIQGSASTADLAVLRQQLAGFGVLQLSPEEAVGLTANSRPSLTVEDAYDAHPVMLPLVLLIEKALELPSDVAVSTMVCTVACRSSSSSSSSSCRHPMHKLIH
jgi:hypothetical protein